jgi:hypothetical protein
VAPMIMTYDMLRPYKHVGLQIAGLKFDIEHALLSAQSSASHTICSGKAAKRHMDDLKPITDAFLQIEIRITRVANLETAKNKRRVSQVMPLPLLSFTLQSSTTQCMDRFVPLVFITSIQSPRYETPRLAILGAVFLIYKASTQHEDFRDPPRRTQAHTQGIHHPANEVPSEQKPQKKHAATSPRLLGPDLGLLVPGIEWLGSGFLVHVRDGWGWCVVRVVDVEVSCIDIYLRLSPGTRRTLQARPGAERKCLSVLCTIACLSISASWSTGEDSSIDLI